MGLESKLQTKIIKELEENLWIVVKTITLSKSGFPDIFAFKNGRSVFLEIKAPDGVASKIQMYRVKKLREQGFTAEFIYSYDEFKQLNL
jgi:Holliday junction resolvase